MTDLRLGAGILAARLVASLIRAVRAGGATTLPGHLARALAPQVLHELGRRLPRGTILVTGTNGKTTASRLLSAILGGAGLVAVHNRAGANLPSGIAAALALHSSPGGTVRGDIGIFEVDEATLPLVTEPLQPRAVVLGNLFRDQLDRYGEIDLVADRWRAALRALPAAGAILYNGDDPLVADIARDHPAARPFGIRDPDVRRGAALEHAADARYCYRCGVPYHYPVVYLGHLGDYACPRCRTGRPSLDVAAEGVRLRGMEGTTFTLATPAERMEVTTVLPGLYNVYNVLAAAAAATAVGVPLEALARAVAGFRPAFGRGERVRIAGRPVYLLLAKNPAGFNEVLRTVLADPRPVTAVIAINDLWADGRDISWLWDVDFEVLTGRVRAIVLAGIRRREMAVRLKYAGLAPEAVTVEGDELAAIERALAGLAEGEPLYVIPTYTALLRLRSLLARRGYVRGFWED